MHNRKKLDRPPSEAEVAALQKKTQTYGSLVSIIFARRKQQENSQDTLDLIGKMLRNNPDFYSLWNFRRDILFGMNAGLEESNVQNKYSGENANAIRDEEMNLSADGIRRNPKSCKENIYTSSPNQYYSFSNVLLFQMGRGTTGSGSSAASM